MSKKNKRRTRKQKIAEGDGVVEGEESTDIEEDEEDQEEYSEHEDVPKVTDMFEKKDSEDKYFGMSDVNRWVNTFSDWAEDVQFLQALPWGYGMATLLVISFGILLGNMTIIKTTAGIALATAVFFAVFLSVVKEAKVNISSVLAGQWILISGAMSGISLTESFKPVISPDASLSIFIGGFLCTFLIWFLTIKEPPKLSKLWKEAKKKKDPNEVVDPHRKQIATIYAPYPRRKKEDGLPAFIKDIWILIIIIGIGIIFRWWIAAIMIFGWLIFVRIISFPGLERDIKSVEDEISEIKDEL